MNRNREANALNDAASDLATKGMLVDPGEHFKGRYEVERKFRVDDLESIRASLVALDAVGFTIGNSESDVFFDFPDGRLAANDQYQVLRHMRPSDRVLWISKGPGPDKCVAMDLTDIAQASAMLQSLGFVETKRIDKKRDIYFIDVFHVTLDVVADLGTFVELAIMTDNQDQLPALRLNVDTMATKLGLHDSWEEMRSYRQMLSDPDQVT